MATITLYAGKMNQMSSLLEGAKKSVSDYQTELFSLKSKTLNVNKSVCDLDDVIRSVQSSTQLQEQKLDSLETLRQNVDNFIADAVRIDGDAAEVINRNKDEFYDKYNYLKPDCEKNLWEKICDGFAAAGGMVQRTLEICRNNCISSGRGCSDLHGCWRTIRGNYSRSCKRIAYRSIDRRPYGRNLQFGSGGIIF